MSVNVFNTEIRVFNYKELSGKTLQIKTMSDEGYAITYAKDQAGVLYVMDMSPHQVLAPPPPVPPARLKPQAHNAYEGSIQKIMMEGGMTVDQDNFDTVMKTVNFADERIA